MAIYVPPGLSKKIAGRFKDGNCFRIAERLRDINNFSFLFVIAGKQSNPLVK